MYKLRDNVTQHNALHPNIKPHISLNFFFDAHVGIYKCILECSNTYKSIFIFPDFILRQVHTLLKINLTIKGSTLWLNLTETQISLNKCPKNVSCLKYI